MSRSDRFDRGDFGARYATSPWGKNGQPYQPVVLSSSQLFVVATVTTIGFTVKTVQGMGGASTVDVASRSGLDSKTSGRTQVTERFR